MYAVDSWIGIQAGKNYSSIIFEDYVPDKKPGITLEHLLIKIFRRNLLLLERSILLV